MVFLRILNSKILIFSVFALGCTFGKSLRILFLRNITRTQVSSSKILHNNICGPMSVPFHGGSSYYILFQENFKKIHYVIFLYFLFFKNQILLFFFKEYAKLYFVIQVTRFLHYVLIIKANIIVNFLLIIYRKKALNMSLQFRILQNKMQHQREMIALSWKQFEVLFILYI